MKHEIEIQRHFWIESEDCEFKAFIKAEFTTDFEPISDREIEEIEIISLGFQKMEFPFVMWESDFKPENDIAKELYEELYNDIYEKAMEYLFDNRYELINF
jgi:hypothetical protein